MTKTLQVYSGPGSGRLGKLRLDFNENTRGCSTKVLDALRSASAESVSAYPEQDEFRKNLARYLRLKPTQVLLTNGGDEAIRLVLGEYARGKKMILPEPTYSMFRVYASATGARVQRVLYANDLLFPEQAILNAITPGVSLVAVVNPNNPTGTLASRRQITRILDKALECGCFVVLDEVYSQFAGRNSVSLLGKYPNLSIIFSFSKAFGLAGLRLGCVVSSERVTRMLSEKSDPYNISSLSLIAGEAALQDVDFVRTTVKETKENVRLVSRELELLGVRVFPSAANFVLANFGSSAKRVFETLRRRGILVRDVSSYPMLEDCLRITIGTKDQCLQLLREVKRVLSAPAFLFDMDGVLVDVSKSYRQAIAKTAEFFTGASVSPIDIQAVKEKTGFNDDWAVTSELIKNRGVAVSRTLVVKKFQELYLGSGGCKGFCEQERWLFDSNLLQRLSSEFRLGIVTGRPRQEAFAALERFKAKYFFDCVVSLEDCPAGKGKPDPYGINLALERMGAIASASFYFGDSVDDVSAAVSAGVRAVGILPPGVPPVALENRLRSKGATNILQSVNEVLEVLA